MKITGVSGEIFEWERPGIWNGGHFYGPGRLHKVTVTTDEGITGHGWNGGTAAERPMGILPSLCRLFPSPAHRTGPDGHPRHRRRPWREADQNPRSRRPEHPGAGRHQHRLLGHQGQGVGPVGAPAAGQCAVADTHLHRRRLLRRGQGAGGTEGRGPLQRRGASRRRGQDQDRRP